MLEVKNWTVHHPLYPEKIVDDNISFKVHKGEVVGFSGLQGAGRTELAMSIFGKSYGSAISGELYIKGEKVDLKDPRAAIQHGLAYVTEDRKTNGLILDESIRFNTTLARLNKVCDNGIINTDLEVQLAEQMTKEMGTKTPSNEQRIGNLSGGNQQKALLGKWMFTEPDILILDEPTRGIDVGAKYDIYCLINQMVEQGKSVIMISSEMPEILGMCDRIYIMNEGKWPENWMRKKLPRKASWHISCRIRRNNEGGKQNECKNKRLFKKIYDGHCTCNRIYPVLCSD